MPVTLEDLISATKTLADSNFATAAALNKLVPAFEQLRRDVYDIRNGAELERANLAITVSKLNADLAVLIDNAKSTQSDVRDLQRDVTGTHMLPPPDTRSTVERMFDRLERAPTSTKLWVFALVLVVIVGFGLHLILAALGIGG